MLNYQRVYDGNFVTMYNSFNHQPYDYIYIYTHVRDDGAIHWIGSSM